MLLRKTILFILFFLSATLGFSQGSDYPFLGEVTSDDVILRAGQNQNFEDILKLRKGDEVIVTDKSFTWLKVKLPPQAKSYIIGKYITLADEKNGEVNAAQVNIRARNSTESTIIGQTNKGAKVNIIAKAEDWYQIEPIDNSSGWVLAEFIKFKDSDISLYNQGQVSTLKTAEVAIPQEEPKSDMISVSGILVKAALENPGEIGYKLKVRDAPDYYLEGMRYLLNDLVNREVEVKGTLMKNSQLSSSVIAVSRVQIIY
ncbi:MAG: SH3 domain-containing protein [Candidatus Omnitrophica bacterium]|nr:SH3 domain-containing protein [Candidatus Omnitrophota bacterium]